MIRQYETRPGRRYPSGASVGELGVNFSVYSRHATRAELLLYASASSSEPFQVIPLDPRINHTFFTWHILVVDLPAGAHYTWRFDGPNDPHRRGLRFDPRIELVDPWARAVTTEAWDRWARRREDHGSHDSPRGVVVGDGYDWEGDEPLRVPSEQTIIYELHVGGFTRHPSSGVQHPGTFAGIIEKIPYLEALGVTHVELMPIMAFDVQDVPKPVWDAGLENYWGYSTHSFFSPHPDYCVTPEQGTHRRELRDLVKALHRAGIGVIMDVVFNHTAEGNSQGPVINFKGLGNETFYCLDQIDKGIYLDFTGCGNTLNANHPFVTRFIIECLEYWVREMHIDGFRFDLASAMARDANGMPMAHPPVIWGIELSEALASTKIIAEAWDAAGLYQVGSFPGYRWMEWNGRYRDSVRRFVRGDPGLVDELATRLAGSSDLYEANLRLPINSINFVTCHDGFTLADLVSYEKKRNEANHEDNRDGATENLSWNCGVEGPTDDPLIQGLRRRQVRNFLSILMLSQGVPMILAGDEVMRTQGGNNNAWCQDNPISWLDWGLVETNRDLLRFTRLLIALRKRHPSLQRRYFLSGRHRSSATELPDIRWHGRELDDPRWNDPTARLLAFTLAGCTREEMPLHVMMNMEDQPQAFALPMLPDVTWRRAVDTGLVSPEDISPPLEQPAVAGDRYRAGPHTVVVLEGG